MTKTVGTPNTTTGIVTGAVKGADGDKDLVTYTQTAGPTKGTVTLSATGAYTYTPTAQARHAAMKPGATTADKQDAFTVAVDDGHGGIVNVTVTVKVGPSERRAHRGQRHGDGHRMTGPGSSPAPLRPPTSTATRSPIPPPRPRRARSSSAPTASSPTRRQRRPVPPPRYRTRRRPPRPRRSPSPWPTDTAEPSSSP